MNAENEHQLTVAIDFDGVISDFSKGWQGIDVMGDPLPGAKEFLKWCKENNIITILHTCRLNPIDPFTGEQRTGISKILLDWFIRHGLVIPDIFWTKPGKPFAHSYVDDRGINFQPRYTSMGFQIAQGDLVLKGNLIGFDQ